MTPGFASTRLRGNDAEPCPQRKARSLTSQDGPGPLPLDEPAAHEIVKPARGLIIHLLNPVRQRRGRITRIRIGVGRGLLTDAPAPPILSGPSRDVMRDSV